MVWSLAREVSSVDIPSTDDLDAGAYIVKTASQLRTYQVHVWLV